MVTILLEELVMTLFLWMLKLIDGILTVFESVSGITNVTTSDGTSSTILEISLGNSTIKTWFWSILLLCVGLLCIFTVAAVIKNMITNQKTNAQIIGKFGLALLGTLAVMAVVILAVLISNEILQLLWEIVSDSGEGSVDIVNTLFNACVGEWYGNYSITQLDGVDKIYELSVKDILGDYKTSAWVFPTEWKYDGMINPDKFYYVPAVIAMFGTTIMLCKVVLSMAKRIFEIVILYLTMPVAMSTLPLDDGARFKNWTEMFISKIVSVFGAVLALRVFMLLLQIVCGITISSNNFVQCLFLVFMTLAGAAILPLGAEMFAQLFGNGNAGAGGGGGYAGHMIMSGISMAGHAAIHVAGTTVNLATRLLTGGAKLTTATVGHRANYNARKQEKAENKAARAETYGTGLIGVHNRLKEAKQGGAYGQQLSEQMTDKRDPTVDPSEEEQLY